MTAILLNQENFTFITKSDLMKAYRQSKNNADSFHLIGVWAKFKHPVTKEINSSLILSACGEMGFLNSAQNFQLCMSAIVKALVYKYPHVYKFKIRQI